MSGVSDRKAAVLALVTVGAFFLVLSLIGLYNGGGLSTGWPIPHMEKLVVSASTDASNSTLIITISNVGVDSTTVTQVLFNNASVALSSITPDGNFTKTSADAFLLASGDTGELLIGRSFLNVNSGQSYDILVMTAVGNEYPTVITWP